MRDRMGVLPTLQAAGAASRAAGRGGPFSAVGLGGPARRSRRGGRPRLVGLLGLCLATCLLVGCASLPDGVAREMAPSAAGEPDPFALRGVGAEGALPVLGGAALGLSGSAASSASAGMAGSSAGASPPMGAGLVSGQLLVWSNPEAVGLFVSLFTDAFSPWTHIGVVSVEPDGVFVYDSNADLRVSATGPATASGSHGVLRTPYARFLDSDRIYGLFDPPPGVNAVALVRFVQDHHHRRTPFDPRYDSADSSALYCSELVALGYEAAGGVAPRPLPVRRNRSYDRLRAWLDLSSDGFVLPGQLVERSRPVAVWARGRNRAQIEALFAARAELARRFGAQTRLGQLMRWNSVTLGMVGALDLRDGPQRLLSASQAAFAGLAAGASVNTSGGLGAAQRTAIAEAVVRLAEQLLGPRPAHGAAER